MRFGSLTKLSSRPLRQPLNLPGFWKMTDPFESAKRKIVWAKKHFDDLKRELDSFIGENPYVQVIEPDPDDSENLLHKVKLVKSFDDTPIAEMVGDVASNLRATLDHATCAIARTRRPHPKSAYFPFARDMASLENSLKGNCKDVPAEFYPLLRSFQPYKGGNERLYALNAMRNADNHAILTPFGTNFLRPYTNVKATGFWEMTLPEHSRWDRAKQEFVLFKCHTNTKLEYELHFHFFIAFEDIEILEGQPLLNALAEMGVEVDATLAAIIAEAQRLGFCQ